MKGCTAPVVERGLCDKHLYELTGRRRVAPRICSVADCGRHVRGRGLCQTHYKHVLKTGQPGEIEVHAPGRPGATPYGPITLTPQTQQVVEQMRLKLGLSRGGAVTQAVEEWAQGRAAKP